MKKICFVTTISATLKSFVIPLAEYIIQNTDWDVTVICDVDPEFARSLPDRIRYIPVPMKRGISLSALSATRRLRRIFKEEKFDLIQYSTPNASLYSALASKLAGAPVRLYCQWGLVYVGMHGVKRALFKRIEKLVCRLSTWIEPDSFGNLDFCHQEGIYPPEKGSVVWNGSACGVSLKKFDIGQKSCWRRSIRERYHIPDDAFTFIFVGRIIRDKGVDELFRAFSRLIGEDPSIYLLMVGGEDDDGLLDAQQYQWAKSDPHIIFTGNVDTVEEYMSAADVYVLPSYREGFGSAVIEAEAMGLPVIVSDIPGPTDAMRKDLTGLTVEKQNDQELYEAMRRLKSDRELCSTLGKNASRFAKENFNQDELFRHITEDRKKLLQSKESSY